MKEEIKLKEGIQPAVRDILVKVVEAIENGGGAITITWDDVQGKPSQFPPEAHTHNWGEVEGKPTEYPPESHTHVVSDVNGLQSTLNDLESRVSALENNGG